MSQDLEPLLDVVGDFLEEALETKIGAAALLFFILLLIALGVYIAWT